MMRNNLLIPILCCFLLIACEGNTDLPTIRIASPSIQESNANETINFEVSLDSESKNEVQVSYATEANTAIAGEDYIEVSGQITFAPGETIKQIAVTIVGDEIKEDEEKFAIRLSNPVNANLGSPSGFGTITNDDTKLAFSDEGYTTPESYAGYELQWADEFEGNSLNMNDWGFDLGDGCPNLCGWGNSELEYYTDSEENVFLSDGKLVIEAKEEVIGGRQYSSGRIKTKGKQTFRYGRIDIRAILPIGQGVWPALWMLPQDEVFGGWAASGEIDIMELVGHEPNVVHGTIHYGGSWPNNKFTGKGYTLDAGDFIDEFHVFSVVWEEDIITWYVDDQEYFQVTKDGLSPDNYPFNEDFFFLFNVAVGGNWPGSPDATTSFPQRMIVDYVRVFQKL
ncbi:MAG: family 16 glycosylhydrolase [Bacteroidota bacterium]